MTEKSWVRIPPGAGLFSLRFSILSEVVPNGGATLLLFL